MFKSIHQLICRLAIIIGLSISARIASLIFHYSFGHNMTNECALNLSAHANQQSSEATVCGYIPVRVTREDESMDFIKP